jgi:CubicO group peptidase (beta-lactamase class C family)
MNGTVHPDFGLVAEVARRQVARHIGGAAVCVYHRGEKVVDLWGGTRDASGAPWEEDTMAPSFSTTKGAASTVVHRLVDRGLLDYDDPVADHWPEFGQAGKDAITLRHVMAHASGLYHLRQMLDSAEDMLEWSAVVAALEAAEPAHPPGERTGYHGLSYGFIVGEIIQRVTGKSFADVVQEELVAPLELDGMYVGAPESALPRAAQLITPERGLSLEGPLWVERIAICIERGLDALGLGLPLQGIFDLAPRGISSMNFSSNEVLRVAMPSVNGLFTARSLARMYAALAAGGELDGVRLLSADVVRRASQVQPKTPHAFAWPIDMKWRLGYHRAFTTRGSPDSAFGHYGFGGSGGYCDLARELAVGLIVNSGAGTPFGDIRTAQIGGAALAAADARS